MLHNPSRMRFRVLVHVERRRLREEIIEFAPVLQRNPSKEAIARLDLMWELEARLTKLLDLYSEWDGTLYTPRYGHTQSIIAEASEIYLQGREDVIPLRNIVATLKNAGLQGCSGSPLGEGMVAKTLLEDRRFERQGRKGWYLVPEDISSEDTRH